MNKLEVAKIFTERLTSWMKATGHTQASLSRALNVNRKNIHHWVHIGNPSAFGLYKLAAYSGVSIDWWLGLDAECVEWVCERWCV